jgi:hypothetical protein
LPKWDEPSIAAERQIGSVRKSNLLGRRRLNRVVTPLTRERNCVEYWEPLTESCFEEMTHPGCYPPFKRSDEMKTLEERLCQLESSHRRWRLAAFGLGAGLLCVVAMGAALKRSESVLRVRAIEVVNDNGECLVRIGAGKWGVGSIATYNNRGKRATIITCNQRGDGLLEISNNDAKRVLAAGASTRGDGLLETYNSNGKWVCTVGANYRGDGLIRAANKRGIWVSRMGAGSDGNGLVDVLTADGSLAKQFP